MRIVNKKVRLFYQILETLQAGIELKGPEVKSIREGKADIQESFVKIRDGEAWLFNAHVYPFKGSQNLGLDPRRSRKLLLHRSQILAWHNKVSQKGLTIIALSLYTTPRLVKAEIALAKARKKFEKREELRRRDIEREVERELRGKE